MSKKFHCPVCKKPLTPKEYQHALDIVELQSRDMDKLKKQLNATKTEAKKAKSEGIRIGKERTKRLFKGKDKTIEVLRQRLKQLQKDKTPQDDGFRFERTFEK